MKVAEYQGGTWAEQAIAPEKDVCPIEDDGIFVDAAVTMGALFALTWRSMLRRRCQAAAAAASCSGPLARWAL